MKKLTPHTMNSPLKALACLIIALALPPVAFFTFGYGTFFLVHDVFELDFDLSNDLAFASAVLATLVAFIIIIKRDPSAFKSAIKKAFYLNRSKANPCYMAQPYSVIALGAIWYAVNWMTYKLFLEFDWFYYEDKHWPAIVASAFVFWLYYPVFWGKKSTTLDDNSDSKFH
tara:strand:+ start:31 stop:543 length:513 start_codon:yes stop_codon:yes gene_type:complete